MSRKTIPLTLVQLWSGLEYLGSLYSAIPWIHFPNVVSLTPFPPFILPSILVKRLMSSSLHTRILKSDKKTLSLLRRCHLTMTHILQIHAQLVVTGEITDPLVSGKIVAFCAISDRGDLDYAHSIFCRISHPTIFLWNTMIRGYVDRSQPIPALLLYKKMISDEYFPNNYTFSFLLKACLDLPTVTDGLKLHAQILRLGWESYDFVQNGLIHMYANCGCLDFARKLFDGSSTRDVISWTAMVHGYAKLGEIEMARKLFDQMPERNVISWSAMITNYAQFGLFEEALGLFKEMQVAGITPNYSGVVGALTACAFLGALDQGRWIHAYVNKNDMKLDRILGTALIDMYAKCGCIETAWQVFDSMPERDVFAYTSVISGLSNHGHSEKALNLFKKMQEEGIRPNGVTFICALSACSRMGLVEEGRRLFDRMTTVYGIQPGVEHYGCLVDLFGRAGWLEDADQVVREMPMEPDSYVLGALLNACRVHGNVELGEATAESLAELGLAHGGVHVLLSNMYASSRQWEEVAKVRKGMEVRKVKKVPGCSMIEMDGVSFEFVAGGDHSNLVMKDIFLALKQFDNHLKLFGLDIEDSSSFNTSFVIF